MVISEVIIKFVEILPKILFIAIGFSIVFAPKKTLVNFWLGLAVAEWAIKNYRQENFAWIIFASLIAVLSMVLAVKVFLRDEDFKFDK